MGATSIISFVIYMIVAIIMIGIGISQLRSHEPVGFYSGEQPPSRYELSDVHAWNKKHGIMWLVYGFIIMISWGIGVIIGDNIWCVIPMCGGVLIPIIIMIWYHNRLIKRYKRLG
ncbi:MAG: hypothetical protein HFJ09_08050 [Lachnospiraceae bacterium]|nr:hypothetical protein [Lachnospiraceae bacterium]